jgi:integrase
MNYLVKKSNIYYATLTIPLEVRPIIGRGVRFFQSTKTKSKPEAEHRAAFMVAAWKVEVAKARSTAPNPRDNFWESLKRQYMGTDDEGTQLAIEEIAEQMASKVTDPVEASNLYRLATNQQGTLLAPLVEDWKASLRVSQKTKDQQYRDVSRMAEYFISLESLKPQKVKAWTDKLLKEKTTADSFSRIGGGCRSLWAYLQQSGTVPMIEPSPFVGAFMLAQKMAVKNTTGRAGSSYSPQDMTKIYKAAQAMGDQPLTDLIALGAYTGARIEELGRLTAETCQDGVFTIRRSKTDAGVRQIPIHPALAPLVARMLKASTDGYLLPSSTDNQYGERASALGKKYGRLKTAQGFGVNLVFHSTRNTLITLMQRAGVSEGIAADIVGHEKQTMTYGLYSSGSEQAQKLEAISTVAYPGALATP